MRRRALLGILLSAVAVLSLALPASANLIPGNPRVGATAITRQRCFVGTVTFTITGNGVSIPVGTTVARPDGWAELSFTVPDVRPGIYNMQGRGTACGGGAGEVNVTFVIRARNAGDPGEYPPRNCSIGIDRSEARPNERARVRGRCFRGPVRFTMNGRELGTANANNNGEAELEFTVPDFPDGDYLVAAAGVDENGEPVVLSTALAVNRNGTVPTATSTTTTAAPAAPAATTAGTPVVDVVVTTPPAAQVEVPTQVLGAVEEATVSNTAAKRSGVLAFTGSDTGSIVRLALIVLAVGSVLVLGTRRRTTRA